MRVQIPLLFFFFLLLSNQHIRPIIRSIATGVCIRLLAQAGEYLLCDLNSFYDRSGKLSLDKKANQQRYLEPEVADTIHTTVSIIGSLCCLLSNKHVIKWNHTHYFSASLKLLIFTLLSPCFNRANRFKIKEKIGRSVYAYSFFDNE